MSGGNTAIYSSTPNLKSFNTKMQSAENIKNSKDRRHSISDFRGIPTSEFQQSTSRYTNYFDSSPINKNISDVSIPRNQDVSSEHSSQVFKSLEEYPDITKRDVSSVDITSLTKDKIRNSSEWISGMPLTPVGSIMFDDIEDNIDTTSTIQTNLNDSIVTVPSMESLTIVEECTVLEAKQSIISSESKKFFLQNKINSMIHDLISRGIFRAKDIANQNIEAGTIYEFVTTALKSGTNPVNSLYDRIKLELTFLLSLVEGTNYESVTETINRLARGDSFKDIINSLSSSNEVLSFLRLVIQDNVNQATNNSDCYVGSEEFNKLQDLLLIYCLAIGRLTVDTDLCEDIDISLESSAAVDKPIWRTSFSHFIDKALSPTAMLMLHMVYWAMTIANSTTAGYVSNNFPNENIIGTIMAIYCSIAITHGSLMNSIRIYRSGQNNPNGSKPLMWSSIFLNTFKDATSLVGSVLSLLGRPAYIPIFQSGNILFSTLFAKVLISRAQEANGEHLNTENLKLIAPLILLPSFLLGSTSIILPYCIPNICESLFGYSGGDRNFLTHSLRSLASNLLTTSNEGLTEANRILSLSSFCASISITSWMFTDINRCQHPQLKKELQSFKGYLIFRYLVTAFTALFSMASPYAPGNKIVKGTINGALTPSSIPMQTINSTTVSSLSTEITPQIAEKVGALYVFLSTCDTGKGIIWEPRVGEFNRKAIKSVLRGNQLTDLRNQFKDSIFNQLGQVNNAEDYLKIVVQAMEEIGFSDKVEKLQATDFEPDWPGILDTVQSMLTVGKTSHKSEKLHINQLFNSSEENIPLLVSANPILNKVDDTDTVLTIDPDDNSVEGQSHLLPEENDSLSDKTMHEPPQANNGRFTVVAINSDNSSIHKAVNV